MSRVRLFIQICICTLIITCTFADINFAERQAIFDDTTAITFEHIGQDIGLKDFSVSSIVQDKHGYIWFATQGGLYKFNGKSTLSYRNDPFETNGLANNLIQTTFYEAESNVLWLGTYQGVSKLDIDTQTFTNYSSDSSELSNNVIVAIQPDAYGNIWFGTMEGLNRLDRETGLIETYEVEGNVVRSLCLDSTNRLLVGTYEGMYYYDEVNNSLEFVDIDYPSKYVMVIKEFEPGVLTLGMWDGGTMELDLNFNVIQNMAYEDNRVYALHQTRDGILWVGTWGGGLFASDGVRNIRFPGEDRKGDIGHTVVYSFLEDSQGILWIGTNGNGVYKLDPSASSYVTFTHDPEDPDALDAGKVNAIYRDSNDHLWIAIYNKGLNRYDPQSDKMIKYKTLNEGEYELNSDQVMDFVEYKGQLLVATYNGVAQYDALSDRFISLDILPKDTIVYSLEVDHENHLWVGTYINGVYHFDDQLNLVERVNSKSKGKKIEDDLIYDLFEDSKERIWIASNYGLYRYDYNENQLTGYFKEQNNRQAIASNNTRVILEDSQERIWVGSGGGGIALYHEEDDTFESFTEKEGLLNNTVISIEESDAGKIWAITRLGISIIDSESNSIVNLTQVEGLGGGEYTGTSFKDNDSIYIGGIHGIDKIPIEHVNREKQFPPIYITNVSVYHEPVGGVNRILNGKTYAFGADQNYLSFDFEALEYSSKSDIQYSFYLKNLDSDWISSGSNNFASYSNIPPGDYTFFVRVSDIQGNVSEPVSLQFSIAVPWYKTQYAYLSYGLLSFMFVYGFVKIREGQLLSRRNSELSYLNLQLEHAVDELEAVSIKDPLTGIFNRRYFDSVFEEYIQLAVRSNSYISLIMLDIDNFKDINDKNGHVFGDHFLQAFAGKIETTLPRSTDFPSRFGGDEFAVVLYDTNEKGALAVAYKLKEAVTSLELDIEGTSISVPNTVSMGVYSAIPEQDTSTEEFMDLADKALYDAKHSGKNQIKVNNSMGLSE